MQDAAADSETRFETVVFLNHFNDVPDPRQRGKIVYPLGEVLLLTLLAVLTGADSFVEIARFSDKKFTCPAASVRSATARRRTITSAISSPPWTRSGFSAVSWPGWRR